MFLQDKIDELLYIDKTDGANYVDSEIRDIIYEEFPEIYKKSEDFDFDISIQHHYEDIHYVGSQVEFYIPDELELLFKQTYPEECV